MGVSDFWRQFLNMKQKHVNIFMTKLVAQVGGLIVLHYHNLKLVHFKTFGSKIVELLNF